MSRLFSTKYNEGALDFSLLLIRLAGGGLMFKHGFDKLIHFTQRVNTFPDPLNIGSTLSLSLTIFGEFFCAVLIVFGLLPRLAAIPLVIICIVATFIVHKGEVFGDGEMAALYLAIFLMLLFVGPGKFSLDRLLGK